MRSTLCGILINEIFILLFQNQLTKAPDAKPLDQDLNFICQYSPKNGIKVELFITFVTVKLCHTVKSCSLLDIISMLYLQQNFNGSNTFATMNICSVQG